MNTVFIGVTVIGGGDSQPNKGDSKKACLHAGMIPGMVWYHTISAGIQSSMYRRERYLKLLHESLGHST